MSWTVLITNMAMFHRSGTEVVVEQFDFAPRGRRWLHAFPGVTIGENALVGAGWVVTMMCQTARLSP